MRENICFQAIICQLTLLSASMTLINSFMVCRVKNNTTNLLDCFWGKQRLTEPQVAKKSGIKFELMDGKVD